MRCACSPLLIGSPDFRGRLHAGPRNAKVGIGMNHLLLSRNPVFGRFWLARTVSYIGSLVTIVALTLHVAEVSGPFSVTVQMLTMSLPRLLGPFAGTVVDRVDTRTLMVGCNLGQGGSSHAWPCSCHRSPCCLSSSQRPPCSRRSSSPPDAAPSPRSSPIGTSPPRTPSWGPLSTLALRWDPPSRPWRSPRLG